MNVLSLMVTMICCGLCGARLLHCLIKWILLNFIWIFILIFCDCAREVWGFSSGLFMCWSKPLLFVKWYMRCWNKPILFIVIGICLNWCCR